ncbi:MAG: protein kinase domain-containing protein [Thermoanaerobaculia bacterium]
MGPGPAPGSGERIGAYEIQGLLGRGGMGEVFLAWDARLRRRVAIKRIRHDHGLNPAMRQRLLREARAVAGLSHPAVVQVYDLIEDAAGDCIILEYVEGRTLAATLGEAGRLEPEAAVRLACEIAGGLAAAHAAGIVHRDLKTENVMVTLSGEAKILDFGVAKPIGTTEDAPSLTVVGHVVGTYRSMSPEQARGAEVDERSDLFSLGVLLYEMLTGISPFQGSNALETLNKVISERPPCADTLRPGLPPRLVALLYRLLTKDPAARPQNATEVVQELHEIAASMGLSGDPDPEKTVSDLPTNPGLIRPRVDDPTPPIPPPQPVPTPLPERPPQPRRWRRLEIAVTLSLVTLLAAAYIFRPPTAPVGPPSNQAPPQKDRSLAPSPPAPDVSDEDRAVFREIQQRIDAAEAPPQPEPRLDQIIARSPHFLEARILAIDLAVSLYLPNKDDARLEHAKSLLQGAGLSLTDPRLLPSRIKVYLAADKQKDAEKALKLLIDREPANIHIPELRARLEDKKNQRENALKDWQLAAKRNPIWQNRLRLAKFEQSFGKVYLRDAKNLLEELRQKNPNNIYVLQALAEHELYYGDPKRAERVFQGLIQRSPERDSITRVYRINLGTALVLLGEYAAAAKTFNDVLGANPNDAEAALNLADAELALNNQDDAKDWYNKVRGLVEWEERGEGELSADKRMIKAQCLAHLGSTVKATEIAKQTVDQNRTNVTLIQTAALVFALARDRQALGYIKEAIDKGIQPEWFKLPFYSAFFDDPEYQALVNGKPR